MGSARSRQIVISAAPNQTPNERTEMQRDDSGAILQGSSDEIDDPLAADPGQFDWEQVITF